MTEKRLPLAPEQFRRPAFASIDAFRGIAALWVVMCHSCLGVIQSRYPQLRHQPLFAISIDGFLGVQIFFVISGFCIANAAAATLQRGSATISFVRARLRRIYPPYFFATLLSVLLSLVAVYLVAHGHLHGSHMARVNLLRRPPMWYLAQATLTQVPLHQEPLLMVCWTLCYEIAFYCIVAVTIAAVRLTSSPGRFLLTVLHVITLASMGVLAMAPSWRIFPFYLWPQFGMGVLVFDFVGADPSRKRPWAVSGALAAELAAFSMSI